MPRISLSDIVGRDATAGNRLPDTLKLKLGLERLGYYEPGKRGFTPGADDGLWFGLESYQRDRGLDVDGIALPDGPTVNALNDDLDGAPSASLITGNFDAALSPEAVAANQRTVRALQSFRGVGDLPSFAVSALRSGDPAAPAEVADLLARSSAEAPEQGKRLREAFAEYLDGDDLARLDAAARARGGAGDDVLQPAQMPKGTPHTVTNAAPKPPAASSPDLDAALKNSRMAPDYRDALAGKEVQGQPDGGYGTTSYDESGNPAYGRYQMKRDALIDAGLANKDRTWTGKYGVKSAEDFLNNPQAQDMAIEDYARAREASVANARRDGRLGQEIAGVKDDITITESGLIAAYHRHGPTAVKNYLDWLDSVGWNSRDNQASLRKEIRSKYNEIETRLREFQNVRYKTPR